MQQRLKARISCARGRRSAATAAERLCSGRFLAELQRRLKAHAAASPEDDVKAALLGGAAGGLANVREEMPFELQALEIVLDVVRVRPGAEGGLHGSGKRGAGASRVAIPQA